MSTCIIGGSNLRYMPYLRYYEAILKEVGEAYDIYYWNRFGIEENHPNAISFNRLDGGNARTRLMGYLAYRRFMLNQLARKRYDTYVALSMQMAVILFDFLKGRRYILDIRDYSHEGFIPYRSIARRLVQESLLTSISSKAFETWLPSDEQYLISHNVLLEDLEKRSSAFNAKTKTVSFVGTIRYMEPNQKFLDVARNIPNLQVKYVGTGPCEKQLQDYCRNAGIENVQFIGPFLPESKPKYLHDTNFILSCYGSSSINERTAIPNRLYDSCVYRRPIIINEGTHLAEMVNKNGIGIVTQLNNPDKLAYQLERYYEVGYYDKYAANCQAFLSSVAEDINRFRASVRQAILEI